MFIYVCIVEDGKSIFSKLVQCTVKRSNKSQWISQVFQNPFSSHAIDSSKQVLECLKSWGWMYP